MFTEKQLEDFKAYRKVQKDGRWNMFDLDAQLATGLERDEYTFVMKNYSKLKAEVDKVAV
jgi:hypothetical protein